ncbi:DUF2946 family protein [Labrenzia sp. OB1]|uniref:DUF2946 family protein n=1 Tax=Labrenzia sp. OB1 TaxID=1561204 RepID=UPI000AB01504|nr:DUF2946 family protein [Labrenzia sp. OB1]
MAVRALLLLPFLLAGLVPQGYMPTVQADGGFTVTLCTTEGLKSITLDANGVEIPPGSGQEDPDHGASGKCLFAGVGAFAVLHEAPGFPLALSAAPGGRPALSGVRLSYLVRGQNDARAPPLTS